MKRNPEALCATCPYFEADRCKRSPPPVDRLRHGMGVTDYPAVGGLDWCGAHPDFEDTSAAQCPTCGGERTIERKSIGGAVKTACPDCVTGST